MNKNQWYILGFLLMVVTLMMSMQSLNAVTHLVKMALDTTTIDTTDYIYLIELNKAQTWCALTALSCMAVIGWFIFGWLKKEDDS